MRAVPGRAGQTGSTAAPAAGGRMEGEGTGTPGTGSAATRGAQVSACVTRVAFEPHLWDTGKRGNK